MPACKNPLKIGAIDTADCRIPLRFPSSPISNCAISGAFNITYLLRGLTFVVPTSKNVVKGWPVTGFKKANDEANTEECGV